MVQTVRPFSIRVGVSPQGEESLLLRRTNRHGVVAGATGTGKTVTLQTLAARLAEQGIPVFAPDVKGDLSSISAITPTVFWDFSGEKGKRITVSVRDIGSTLFSRLLDLNETQEGVVTILFVYARENRLPLNTLLDVRHALNLIVDDQAEVARDYGHIDARTIATIQRKLLMLRESGAGEFFGKTNFAIGDLKTGVNILRAESLIHDPSVYAVFLFWLLSEMFRKMPEVGDLPQPKLVFFFDEAHLLFQNASRAFLQKVEQVVRLIRSKGVGVYFVTQSPADIPDSILAQLGNRIQHALRAYTPSEQKALKAAAQSFRENPEFDTAATIQTLGVGEALVSLLDENGVPKIVQRTRIDMLKAAKAQRPSTTFAPRPMPEKAVDAFGLDADLMERDLGPLPTVWLADKTRPVAKKSRWLSRGLFLCMATSIWWLSLGPIAETSAKYRFDQQKFENAVFILTHLGQDAK